ncbi:MAG: PH domain-containing protein [Candidatus Saccharimonadales bacterium]
MVTKEVVETQLKAIGCNYGLWGSTEINELHKILWPGETIQYAINGYYDGGFALMCVTTMRVLIIDKKPLSFTVEDLRYDMIAEVDYTARIVTARIYIVTPLRTLIFTGWGIKKVEASSRYIQHRLMDIRSDPHFWAHQFEQIYGEREKGGFAMENPDLIPSPMDARAAIQKKFSKIEVVPSEAQILRSHELNPFLRVPTFTRRRKYPSFY